MSATLAVSTDNPARYRLHAAHERDRHVVAPIEPSPVGAGGVHYSLEDDRLVEVSDEGSTELGRVVAGHAGARLVLAWHGRHWAAASADHTEVEITFEPDGAGTRVTVEHRGWTGVRTGDAATAVIGLWWGDLLAGYTYRADHREPAGQR